MSRSPLVVAITGTIGSGKSVVGNLLAQRGVIVIDADALAREVVEVGQPALSEIQASFGSEVIETSGALNRKSLSAIVFNDHEQRLKLESILHPKIRANFLSKLAAISKSPRPDPWIVAYLVPLLFESGYEYAEIEKIVVVSCSPEQCIQRIIKRDRITRESAEKRIASQLPIEMKEQKADFIVRNSGSLSDLEKQVDGLFLLLSKAQLERSSTS